MWVSTRIITGSMITGIYSHEDDSSVEKIAHINFVAEEVDSCAYKMMMQ
jgi:hypothetical protein